MISPASRRSPQRWPKFDRTEQRAHDFVLEACKRLDVWPIPAPIPIEEWVEKPLGYQLAVEDLSPLGPDVLGAANIGTREILVSETVWDDVPRTRFTIAHELGHHVLHGHLHESYQDGDVLKPVRGNQPIETEANRFAAYFLLPWVVVEREMAAIAVKYEITKWEIEALPLASPKSLFLWKYRFLPEITRRFNVSLSAAVLRFSRLLLPNGKPVLHPSLLPELMTSQRSIGGLLMRRGLVPPGPWWLRAASTLQPY